MLFLSEMEISHSKLFLVWLSVDTNPVAVYRKNVHTIETKKDPFEFLIYKP